MLKENTLFGETDKVSKAIDRLKAFEPEEGYYLAFSGGKDSVVIKALADMAGVKYDAHYSLTTVDPPELVRFIKEKHPEVEIVKPKLSMWKLIEKNRDAAYKTGPILLQNTERNRRNRESHYNGR